MTYRHLAWTVFLIGGVWGVAGFAFDIPGTWFFLTIMVWANGILDTGDRRLRQMEYLRRAQELDAALQADGRAMIFTAYRVNR